MAFDSTSVGFLVSSSQKYCVNQGRAKAQDLCWSFRSSNHIIRRGPSSIIHRRITTAFGDRNRRALTLLPLQPYTLDSHTSTKTVYMQKEE